MDLTTRVQGLENRLRMLEVRAACQCVPTSFERSKGYLDSVIERQKIRDEERARVEREMRAAWDTADRGWRRVSELKAEVEDAKKAFASSERAREVLQALRKTEREYDRAIDDAQLRALQEHETANKIAEFVKLNHRWLDADQLAAAIRRGEYRH